MAERPRGRPNDSAYLRWLLPRLSTTQPRTHSVSPPRVPAPSTASSTPRDVSWDRGHSRANSLDISPLDPQSSTWGRMHSPMSTRSRLGLNMNFNRSRLDELREERQLPSGEITPDISDSDSDGEGEGEGGGGTDRRRLQGSTIAYRDYEPAPDSPAPTPGVPGLRTSTSSEDESVPRGRLRQLLRSPPKSKKPRRSILPDWLTGNFTPPNPETPPTPIKPERPKLGNNFLAPVNSIHPKPDLERKDSAPKETDIQFHPVLVLENSGSVARDHLANERTFLAYVRTSLSIASTGVGLVQLFSLSLASMTADGTKYNKTIQRFARPMGATMVILGMIILAIGFLRFFRVQTSLVFGYYPPARRIVTFLSSAIALIIAVVFGLLVATPRR